MSDSELLLSRIEKLTSEQIRAELARECEGPRWLLEARRWRLEFELRYREGGNGRS
jgi:hypothetical protein